ncbi:hypothetical protein PRIPAC_95844 [Pristionchus pacificus]|uniref:Uncharacterized protein n=1 Tax=Pristionchus pacificus TaxID=54126 RepID=A0A454XN69_PRIPA|nr:hypothetical protein PRIPAC_95844 [Pristionchus pacificus]|eukprot:PDM84760.1 hypothetical protein PRIPAC_33783 [Pristionchus pacificus]
MDPQCELAEELFYSGKLHVLQWIHVMPYYCLIAPLTLLILIRHGRFERNHALRGLISPSRSETVKDVYFLQLRDQWSHNLNFAAD